MKNKNKYIIGGIIIGIVLLIILGAIYMYPKVSGSEGLISYRLYDAQGNQVKSTLQSVVGGVSGVSQMDLTITLTNTGEQALVCNLYSLSPSQFSNALTPSTKTLPVGGKAAWTSGLMPLSTLENPNASTVFSVITRCSYTSGSQTITLPDKVGTLSLDIKPEEGASAGYEVEITQGGVETEYCGDDICQSSENEITCPNDCAISSNIKFRTTDLSYITSSAIGYSSSCGTTLTGYGFGTKYSSRNGLCTTDRVVLYNGVSESLPVTYVMDLPGTFNAGGTNPVRLYRHNTDSTLLYVCDDDGSQYQSIRYSSSDADASKVDTSSSLIDSAKEVTC